MALDREPPTQLEKKNGHASKYQLACVARMTTEMAPMEEIVKQVGLTENHIKRLLKGGANKQFDELKEGYEEIATGEVIVHRLRLSGMLEKAYDGVKRGLDAKEPKTSAGTAWELFDRVYPSLSPAAQNSNRSPTEGLTGMTFIFNQPPARAELDQGEAGVIEDIRDLQRELAGIRLNRHELVGDEALPTPPAQLEILDVEALPNQEDAEQDSLGLVEQQEAPE